MPTKNFQPEKRCIHNNNWDESEDCTVAELCPGWNTNVYKFGHFTPVDDDVRNQSINCRPCEPNSESWVAVDFPLLDNQNPNFDPHNIIHEHLGISVCLPIVSAEQVLIVGGHCANALWSLAALIVTIYLIFKLVVGIIHFPQVMVANYLKEDDNEDYEMSDDNVIQD